ncbi:hypothetical protein VT84_09400 [Gemmata sp. SH-PL17]|uniref:hypothetical protein n=1 Tax=Gemmata sp. SH-PL17 TaxID=1630693 RepID=UPI00078D034A|nr:hypothetical protein [Gemmata sp. SH-PL17]AMV24599.1 hypothetical protein VT84_09400 [Gemmata sp. SH-PL17]
MMTLLLALAVAICFGARVVTHTFTFGHAGGSVSLSDSVQVTGELATEANIAVAASTTNQQENIAFNHTNLQGVYIKSDVTVTLKTNSSGSPDNTITITAGKPFVWYAGCGIANPFTAAVTTTYWTNATADPATIYMRTLVS